MKRQQGNQTENEEEEKKKQKRDFLFYTEQNMPSTSSTQEIEKTVNEESALTLKKRLQNWHFLLTMNKRNLKRFVANETKKKVGFFLNADAKDEERFDRNDWAARKRFLELKTFEFSCITYPEYLLQKIESVISDPSSEYRKSLVEGEETLQKLAVWLRDEDLFESIGTTKVFLQEEQKKLRQFVSKKEFYDSELINSFSIKDNILWWIKTKAQKRRAFLSEIEDKWEKNLILCFSAKNIIESLQEEWDLINQQDFYSKSIFLAWLKTRITLLEGMFVSKNFLFDKQNDFREEFCFLLDDELNSKEYKDRENIDKKKEQEKLVDALIRLLDIAETSTKIREKKKLLELVWFSKENPQIISNNRWKNEIGEEINRLKDHCCAEYNTHCFDTDITTSKITVLNFVSLLNSCFFCLDEDYCDSTKYLENNPFPRDWIEADSQLFYYKEVFRKISLTLSETDKTDRKLINKAKTNLIVALRNFQLNTIRISLLLKRIKQIKEILKEFLNDEGFLQIMPEECLAGLKVVLKCHSSSGGKKSWYFVAQEYRKIEKGLKWRESYLNKVIEQENLQEFFVLYDYPDFFDNNGVWQTDLFTLGSASEEAELATQIKDSLLEKTRNKLQYLNNRETSEPQSFIQTAVFLICLENELAILKKTFDNRAPTYFLCDDTKSQCSFFFKQKELFQTEWSSFLQESKENLEALIWSKEVQESVQKEQDNTLLQTRKL